MERIEAKFLQSPKTSTAKTSWEPHIPQSMVWRFLRKRLRRNPYKLQLLQALNPTDNPKRPVFYFDMIRQFVNGSFAERLVFSDEATFHLSGQVYRHNVRILGLEKPREFIEYKRDSAKLNVLCDLSNRKVYRPFSFIEGTNIVCQLDGAHPHFKSEVREFLNDTLPDRWIGRSGNEDSPLMRLPPRSPDVTAM